MQWVRSRQLHPLLHKHGGYFANARFFLLGVFFLVVIMAMFFRGSQRCLHQRWNQRTKKARRNNSPSLGRGKHWIHFMSWSNCLYAFVDLIRVAGSCLKRHSPLPFHLNCHCFDQPTNLSQPQWRDEVDVERSSQNLWNGTFHRALFDPTTLCYKVLRLDENITCISFELLKRSSYITKRM